jgi:hypothetical protein
MVRRTISLPAAVDEKIRKVAEEEGSYSAAVARLVDEAVRKGGRPDRPRYIGSVDDSSLPTDFARQHEEYWRKALDRIARRR